MVEPLMNHGTERRCPKNLFQKLNDALTYDCALMICCYFITVNFIIFGHILYILISIPNFFMNFNTRTFKSSRRINQIRFAKQSWVLYFYNLLTDINDANYEQKQSFVVVFIFIYIMG